MEISLLVCIAFLNSGWEDIYLEDGSTMRARIGRDMSQKRFRSDFHFRSALFAGHPIIHNQQEDTIWE